MPTSPRKSEKEEEMFPPKWAQLFSLDGWKIVNKDYETCLGPRPGVDFTKGFKTWHKFITEICFMLIPIIVLFIAHKFITGNF